MSFKVVGVPLYRWDYKTGQHIWVNWRLYDGKCPECNGQMIENLRFIECGERGCTYIQEVKSYD